jgi:hypothetical protein
MRKAFLLEFDALSWNFPTLHLFLFISPGTYMARFPHPCFRFFTHDCQSNDLRDNYNLLSLLFDIPSSGGKVCRDLGSESIDRWTAARSQLNRLSAIFDKMLAIGASCVICLRYCHHSHEDTAATISYLSNSLRLSLVRRLTFSAIQLPLSAPWTNGVGSSRAQ